MALLDQIIGAESGGNPLAKNPRSSATGLGQFISDTWIDMLSRHRPDIKGSREELLELRKDPALSRAMTEAYAADNGAVLSGAGLPVNPANTYLAHFAGPQGAVKVLQADPNAPIEGILGAKAVAANPFLKGMTVADLQAWAGRKMGAVPAAAPQQPAAQPAPATPASPPQATPAMPASIMPQRAYGGPSGGGMASADLSQFPSGLLAQAPPLIPPPRKPPDLRALRAAFARPSGGLFLGRG